MTTMTRNRPVGTMSTEELRGEITHVQATLGLALKQMGPNYDMTPVTVLDGDGAEKAAEFERLSKRATALFAEYDARPAGQPITPENGNGIPVRQVKSLGERITGSPDFRKNSQDFEVPWSAAEAKADFTTSAGWVPESTRSGVIATYPTRPRALGLLDLIGTPVPWSQASYPYMQETTYNPGAVVEKAEGVTFGEAELVVAEATEPIRKIPVFLPVTDESLDDSPQAREYIDARLSLMLNQRLELQLLVGDGSAPNISGYGDRAGIQTQAKASDPVFDAIFKAITKIETVGFAIADGIVMNPLDWEGIRLTRTTDGLYLLGNPAEIGPKSLFGLPVVTTTAQTENTALVGAFRDHSDLIERQGIEIKVSDSHAEFFSDGKQAIRATMRAGLAVYRESAFCEVTGI